MNRLGWLAVACALGLGACGPRPAGSVPTPTPALATIAADLPTTLAAFQLPPAATPMPPPTPVPVARAPYPAPATPPPTASPLPTFPPGASPQPGVAPLALSRNFNCIANCGSQDGNYVIHLELMASGGATPYIYNPGPTFEVVVPHCTNDQGLAKVTSADGQTAQAGWVYHDVACP